MQLDQDKPVTEPEPGDAVLVLGPQASAADTDHCRRLLSFDGPQRSEETARPPNVVIVSLTGSIADRLSAIHLPADATIGTLRGIVLDTHRESESEAVGGEEFPTIESSAVTSISDPGDLPHLALTISHELSELDPARETYFCFHSLTALLQYTEVPRLYRFLHTLTGRLGTMDAVSHFHIDPSAHEDNVLATLEPLFDETVET